MAPVQEGNPKSSHLSFYATVQQLSLPNPASFLPLIGACSDIIPNKLLVH